MEALGADVALVRHGLVSPFHPDTARRIIPSLLSIDLQGAFDGVQPSEYLLRLFHWKLMSSPQTVICSRGFLADKQLLYHGSL